MTKSELIEQVSELLKLPNGKAEQIVNCIFDSMVKALQEDDGIEIRGFGSFTVREYKSYDGRNPRTGETVHVAPKRLPFFKVGKDLRERVNRGAGRAMPPRKPVTTTEHGETGHSEIGSGRFVLQEDARIMGSSEGARADAASEAPDALEAGASARSAPSDSLSSSSISARGFGSSESGWE